MNSSAIKDNDPGRSTRRSVDSRPSYLELARMLRIQSEGILISSWAPFGTSLTLVPRSSSGLSLSMISPHPIRQVSRLRQRQPWRGRSRSTDREWLLHSEHGDRRRRNRPSAPKCERQPEWDSPRIHFARDLLLVRLLVCPSGSKPYRWRQQFSLGMAEGRVRQPRGWHQFLRRHQYSHRLARSC
jgi:hypothetical protein